MYMMIKWQSRGTMKNDRLWRFRTQAMKLYKEFEANLESLCQQHEVKINYWYSPSKIPQPEFVIGKKAVDADTLYNEKALFLQLQNNYKTRNTSHARMRKRLQRSKIGR